MNEPLQPDYLKQCEIRLLKDRQRLVEELAIERAKRHEQRAAIDGWH